MIELSHVLQRLGMETNASGGRSGKASSGWVLKDGEREMGWKNRVPARRKQKSKGIEKGAAFFHLFIQQTLTEFLEYQRAGQTWSCLSGDSSLEGRLRHELVNKQANAECTVQPGQREGP